MIENPKSTETDPLPDIPIMVFTKDQWELVDQDVLVVSAAGVLPDDLGRNSKYVFALPPRFIGFTDDHIEAQEEIGNIVGGNPLHAFKPR